MNNQHPGDWMFATPRDPDQPIDLGYAMGARMVETFYIAAADKAEAVQEIISIHRLPGLHAKEWLCREIPGPAVTTTM